MAPRNCFILLTKELFIEQIYSKGYDFRLRTSWQRTTLFFAVRPAPCSRPTIFTPITAATFRVQSMRYYASQTNLGLQCAAYNDVRLCYKIRSLLLSHHNIQPLFHLLQHNSQWWVPPRLKTKIQSLLALNPPEMTRSGMFMVEFIFLLSLCKIRKHW
jgi:hypothetical protein